MLTNIILKELLSRLLGSNIQLVFMKTLPEYNQLFGDGHNEIKGYTYDTYNGLKILPNDHGYLNMKVVDGNTDYLIVKISNICRVYHLNGTLRTIRKSIKAVAI